MQHEIKPVNPKGNQSWIFIGRTDAEAPILWPPNAKSQLIGKDPDARKDWRQKEKETTEGDMVGWHHWHNGHEFEQAPGDSEGQVSLVCCSSWGHKESDTTKLLHFTLQSLTYALRFFNKWLDILSNMEHGLARNNQVEIGSNYLPGYSWSSQSVQSLNCVRLFATLWTTARQASLSITNSQSLLKFMTIESVTPSNHLILCRPLLLLPSIFPGIRVFF